MQGQVFLSNYIGSIYVDVRISDAHVIASEIATNPLETGAKVSDHIIQQPRLLSIVFEQANTNSGLARARNVWAQFVDEWNYRRLISVATEHEFYKNMAIQNVSALHSVPFKGALQIAVSLVQVNSVVLEYVKVPESQLKADSNGTNKTASSTVEAGTQGSTKLSEQEDLSMAQKIHKSLQGAI